MKRQASNNMANKREVTTDVYRCPWAKGAEYIQYHDTEWGVPIHDDRLLFEFLILEGAQAGLSWSTILKKRDNYREAFANFETVQVADYDEAKVTELLGHPGLVRNGLKIRAAIQNAQAFLAIQEEFGNFATYIWQSVGGQPRQNAWQLLSEIPAETAEARAMSKDLKKRGFKFVGPTICYAFMQAVGMVNDHTIKCFRHNEIRDLVSSSDSPIAGQNR